MVCQKEQSRLAGMKKQRYDINQCVLYKCRSKKKLISLLDISSNEYDDISNVSSYHSFNICKKDINEKRTITAPDNRLKIIQKRLLRLIKYIRRPEWLISGEKGKCYIDNGKTHLNSKYILTIDIKKFYDNCKREYVFRFFKDRLLMAGDIAGFCTDLVCLEGGIPTGCPTSQLIAFYAYENMFTELFTLAEINSCIFTVYVDDMTFSSATPFEVNRLKKDVDILLRKYGHKPKYKKVKYYNKDTPAPITGTIVTVDNELKIPNNLQKKVYDSFQEIKEIMEKGKLSVADEKKLITLNGQIQSARNIEHNKFAEIKRLSDRRK